MKYLPVAMASLGLSLSGPVHASFQVPANAPGQYAPREECDAVPGATPFLARLKAAVKKRDRAAFAELASEDIFLDLGAGGGREEVRERLKKGSKLWRELDRLLALGCAFDEERGQLVMPWFYAQDLGDADPFSTVVTLGKAPVKDRPSRKGKVLAMLDWQLVVIREVEVNDPGYETVAVIDSDVEGHVKSAALRSQLDYRLVAEKVGDEWRIVYFLAGE